MDDNILDILKSYGIYYVEIDREGNRKEFIQGSLDDVLEAYTEILKPKKDEIKQAD